MGNSKNIAFWVILFVLLIALFNVFSSGGPSTASSSISYSQFLDQVETGNVQSVTLDGEKVYVTLASGERVQTIQPSDNDLVTRLRDSNVEIKAAPQEQSAFTSILVSLLPIALLIGIWLYFMNRMQGGGKGGAMGFGKSKAKMLTERQGKVTFD
ncbi:MAG: ATP-dependent metallopeptidase FtsH/Yme1/Tma family protein, partial [Pseudomonadota bacterium]